MKTHPNVGEKIHAATRNQAQHTAQRSVLTQILVFAMLLLSFTNLATADPEIGPGAGSDSSATELHAVVKPQYTLTIGTAGLGKGAVTASPKAASYASGTVVTLTAVPATGSTFANWAGAAAGSAKSIKVKITGNTAVTATFNVIPQCTLTIGMAGSGAGTVTVSPKASAYASGTVVTLTAVPGPGCTFSGWSGATAGSAKRIKVKITGNTAVTAAFNITSIAGSNYAGTWIGQFNVQYQYFDGHGNLVQGSRGFHVTMTLKSLAAVNGISMLTITKVSSDDAYFETGLGEVPAAGSIVMLPTPPENSSTAAGAGVEISFANGISLSTANDVGELHMSSDGSLISNSVGTPNCWTAVNTNGNPPDYLCYYLGVPNDGYYTVTQTSWSFTHSAL